MALSQLLAPSSTPEQFFRDYFLKQPLTQAGGAAHAVEWGSWSVVERLLRSPQVDVVVGREGQAWSGDPTQVADQARHLLDEGYTLGIRHAERHDAMLDALAREFAAEFAAPVNIHLYCTPASQPGFGWHYDAEDVFILQTQGSKQWSLRKNTVNPWPLMESLPRDMRYDRELMPLMRCTLQAGDWLYIPAGHWHRTEGGEESISLSVGVDSVKAIDVFDFLRRRLLDDLRWRQRLPTPGAASPLDADELTAAYQELLADLGRDLAQRISAPDFATAFIQHCRGASEPSD